MQRAWHPSADITEPTERDTEPRIVMLEPNPDHAYALVDTLAQSDWVFHVEHAQSLVEVYELLREDVCTVVLVDIAALTEVGLRSAILRMISLRPDAGIVLLTDRGQEDRALEAVRLGAHDYILRDRDSSRLAARVVSSAMHRQNQVAELQHRAHHDALTGLANRAMLEACLGAALQHPHARPAVLYLDLDGFKPVNDTHGHAAGDQVLRTVAARLRHCASVMDLVSRVGGDEFALLIEGAVREGDLVQLGGRILSSLAEPIRIEPGIVAHVSCSVGIAWADERTTHAATLLRAADEAMYQAKRSGPGTIHLFRGGPDAQARIELKHEIAHALDRDELEVHYQAQVGRQGEIRGVEALLRWRQSEGFVMGPSQFVPLLEESGQIVDVGRWVLRTALTQLRTWWREGVEIPRMSVNVSPVQLQDPGFADEVERALANAGVPASALEIEVTERIMLPDSNDCARTIARIRALGTRFALDDFGTGYASLGYLHDYPIDTLKVDRKFVAGIFESAKIRSIVEVILDLSQRLDLVCIAEGVETEAQAAFLRERGCEILQGFLFSRPAPALTFQRPLATA